MIIMVFSGGSCSFDCLINMKGYSLYIHFVCHSFLLYLFVQGSAVGGHKRPGPTPSSTPAADKGSSKGKE